MFSIGDLARSGRVSVRMLRHYDTIGLLRPASVDPFTGYRSYAVEQLTRLNRVVALKDLGFTLDQVAAIVDDDIDSDELRGMLRLRRAELRDQIAADTARLARVEARLRVIEREDVMSEEVEIKTVPARKTIARAGEPLNQSTLLIEGIMSRYLDDREGLRQLVAIHLPGDFLDLHAFPLKVLDHDVATLTAATALGLDLDVAVNALATAQPFAGRLLPVQVPSGAIILRDDYNASIDAIEASLKVLEQTKALRRLLVITDMSDFGRNRKQRFKYLAAEGARVADAAVFIGELAEYGKRRAIDAGLRPEAVHAFPSLQGAAEFLKTELRSGDVMLLKGRTTDHATRIFFAQLGTVKCWKEYCGKRMLCDMCPELGLTREERGQFAL